MINIYCDESCHLPNDNIDTMVLGAVTCPAEMKEKVYEDIRAIKLSYELDSRVEVKWTKVGKAKIDMYKDLVEYFFNNNYLSFRGLVVKDKSLLNHEKYNGDDSNVFYYKMYYYLLDKLCYLDNQYRIFIDVKDTNGGPRLEMLKRVLCNNKYDFKNDIITEICQVNSNRSDIMQLTDLFIGMLSFYHRKLYSDPDKSMYKKELIDLLISRVGLKTITNGTSPHEPKFNVFVWTPRR